MNSALEHIKNVVNSLLAYADIRVTKKSTFDGMVAKTKTSSYEDLTFLKTMNSSCQASCLDLLAESKSQLRQDLFVLSELGFKKSGFFVEFGATNGVDLSNSFLLEKQFGWDGILAEPAKMWHSALDINRNVFIEKRCVWKVSGETLSFNETEVGELSTIDDFSNSDEHKSLRENGKRYNVESISLNELLDSCNAPSIMDYLSIDTEGSELEILEKFDFNRYKFRVITCEHNFTSNREKVHDLLSKNGYQRKFEEISKFDDWYVATEK